MFARLRCTWVAYRVSETPGFTEVSQVSFPECTVREPELLGEASDRVPRPSAPLRGLLPPVLCVRAVALHEGVGAVILATSAKWLTQRTARRGGLGTRTLMVSGPLYAG
jgi:hypothetical protein